MKNKIYEKPNLKNFVLENPKLLALEVIERERERLYYVCWYSYKFSQVFLTMETCFYIFG